MSSPADVELQRARWRRALRLEALDATSRSDFAVAGLASRLGSPSVQLLLLPADPEADVIRFDDGLWAWANDFQVVNLDGRNLHLGAQHVPTAHAAAIVESYGSREAWNSYVAIHRSGALEYGLGDRGAWERKDRVRVFNLISVVARTWALLKFGSALRDRTRIEGPFQLTMALHRTGGAFLGNVAQGWAEPLTWDNDLPACRDEHLLWHLEDHGVARRRDDRRRRLWRRRPTRGRVGRTGTPLPRSHRRPRRALRHQTTARVGLQLRWIDESPTPRPCPWPTARARFA